MEALPLVDLGRRLQSRLRLCLKFSSVHNRMSTAYATLLAQVVPVLALALGLELRASVGRRNEQAAAAIDADNSKPGFWHGASVGIFGFILTSSPVSRSGHCTWSPARMGSGMT